MEVAGLETKGVGTLVGCIHAARCSSAKSTSLMMKYVSAMRDSNLGGWAGGVGGGWVGGWG